MTIKVFIENEADSDQKNIYNEIKIIKSDERGVIYDCGKSSFIARKKEQLVRGMNTKIRRLFIWLREK